MRSSLLLIALGLAACQTGNGSGYNDDPHEGYVDPGPSEIALAVAQRAGEAVDAAGQPAALWTRRVWTDLADDWLYVVESGDPTREHIVRVTFGRGGYPLEVYRIPASALPADTTANALFADLSPSDLELADGCTVWMDRMGPFEYAGLTEGADCASPRDDTAYETLEVVIGDSLLWSRRGFDDDGTQLWGPPL